MCGGFEDTPGRTPLDDLAGTHDDDLAAQAGDHGQIVRDQQLRRAMPCLQSLHERQNPLARGGIQRRDRLVGNQQLRAGCDRPGKTDTLPLAARQAAGQALP